MTLTWVVGSGGLLGGHLTRAIGDRGGLLWTPAAVTWGGTQTARTLRATAEAFIAASGDAPWQVLWSAGAGVTGASEESLELELEVFAATLDGLSAGVHGRGSMFFASSAGGVYAGGLAPPFNEDSPTAPLAPYGRAKLRAEGLLRDFGLASGTAVLAGRIANLYGPGQNLSKPQGLISQMLKAQLSAQPMSIYVSLDTLRDYLYAPDCAALVLDAMDVLRSEQATARGPVVRTKILASHRAVTIGAIISEIRLISKRRPRIVIAASPLSAFQARNLSLRSTVWPQLDHRPLTPLAVGIHRTSIDLSLRWQAYGATMAPLASR